MSASILKGVSEIFDEWLGLAGNQRYGTRSDWPKYDSKQACIDLSRQGGPLVAEQRLVPSVNDVIARAMSCLESNLEEVGAGKASPSNWKWEKSLHLSPESRSPEKVLEKLVTFLLGEAWVNQIPTCNGLVPEGASACRIDLALRLAPECYELIELKFGEDQFRSGSNHPLYAAMELVEYGLLYLLFRKHRLLERSLRKEHELLLAKSVDLIVLAPLDWYSFGTRSGAREQYRFSWLEQSVTQGLRDYLSATGLDLQMSLRFQALPSEFTAAFNRLAECLYGFRETALHSRTAVYSGN